jgi:threonine aldolase
MYKYFNAPFGAVLSGPASLIARIEPLRHQFGSLIYQGWESAAVALHHFDGFAERYQTAVRNGEKLFELLQASGKFRIERVPSGSNIAKLRLASGGALDQLRDRLAAAGIRIGGAKDATVANLSINETINRRSVEDIVRAFLSAAA